jgi:hypothetical protein
MSAKKNGGVFEDGNVNNSHRKIKKKDHVKGVTRLKLI